MLKIKQILLMLSAFASFASSNDTSDSSKQALHESESELDTPKSTSKILLRTRSGTLQDVRDYIPKTPSLNLESEKRTKRLSTGEVAGKLLKKQKRISKVPQELQSISYAFQELLEKPEKIDIIIVFEGDGKTHAYLLTEFLKTFERSLSTKLLKCTKISDCVGHFIGSGSGSIPAALGALDLVNEQKNLYHISKLSSKHIIPGFLSTCAGLFNTAKTITQNVVSACSENPEFITDNSEDLLNLSFDKINITKSEKRFKKLFKNKSTNDLIAPLEIVGSDDCDDISSIVSSSIRARNTDAKSKIKRVAIAETISTLGDMYDTASNKDIGTITDKINFKLIEASRSKSVESKSKVGGIVNKVRTSENNLILINVRADTTGDIGTSEILLTSNADMKYTKHGTKNININYRFAVPNELYSFGKLNESNYYATISSAVSRAFPTCNQSRRTNNTILTGLTLDFLTQYVELL